MCVHSKRDAEVSMREKESNEENRSHVATSPSSTSSLCRARMRDTAAHDLLIGARKGRAASSEQRTFLIMRATRSEHPLSSSSQFSPDQSSITGQRNQRIDDHEAQGSSAPHATERNEHQRLNSRCEKISISFACTNQRIREANKRLQSVM